MCDSYHRWIKRKTKNVNLSHCGSDGDNILRFRLRENYRTHFPVLLLLCRFFFLAWNTRMYCLTVLETRSLKPRHWKGDSGVKILALAIVPGLKWLTHVQSCCSRNWSTRPVWVTPGGHKQSRLWSQRVCKDGRGIWAILFQGGNADKELLTNR